MEVLATLFLFLELARDILLRAAASTVCIDSRPAQPQVAAPDRGAFDCCQVSTCPDPARPSSSYLLDTGPGLPLVALQTADALPANLLLDFSWPAITEADIPAATTDQAAVSTMQARSRGELSAIVHPLAVHGRGFSRTAERVVCPFARPWLEVLANLRPDCECTAAYVSHKLLRDPCVVLQMFRIRLDGSALAQSGLLQRTAASVAARQQV